MSARADRRLRQLREAAQPLRFRLLRHACTVGPFTASEAAAITGTSKSSGNARTTHAERLVGLGLLRRNRRRPAQYSATASGRAVYEALAGALPIPEKEPQPVALLAVIRGAAIDDLVEADDLVVALAARLRDVKQTTQATYRLAKTDG